MANWSILFLVPVISLLATEPSAAFNPKQVRAKDPHLNMEGAKAAGRSLKLTMNVVGQRRGPNGDYSEVLVQEGSVLDSYDHFQLHMETNRPAFVYVLLFDSRGRARQLFPDPKIKVPGFVKAGKWVVVPGDDLWFWLDEKTGTETLYLLASLKPMTDIRSLLARMEAADPEAHQRISLEMRRRIVQRGLAVVAKGAPITYSLSDGKRIRKVTDVVTGSGSVVRALSFQHR